MRDQSTTVPLVRVAARSPGGDAAAEPGAADKTSMASSGFEVRYELLDSEVLGRGPSATVYEGYDHNSKRRVAIKRLHNRRQVESVWRTVSAAGNLPQHDRLLKPLDADRASLQIVLELQRASFEKYCNGRSLPAEQAPQILRDLIAVLDAIHTVGRLHGAIHPGNLLIAADGSIRLADARAYEQGEAWPVPTTQQCHLAPEVLKPRLFGEVGPASDLYCLASTMLHALTGPRYTPWLHGTGSSLSKKHVDWLAWHAAAQQKFPAAREIVPDLDEAVGDILDRMLSKSVNERPESAGEVLAELGGRGRHHFRAMRRIVLSHAQEHSETQQTVTPASGGNGHVRVVAAPGSNIRGVTHRAKSSTGFAKPDLSRHIVGIRRVLRRRDAQVVLGLLVLLASALLLPRLFQETAPTVPVTFQTVSGATVTVECNGQVVATGEVPAGDSSHRETAATIRLTLPGPGDYYVLAEHPDYLPSEDFRNIGNSPETIVLDLEPRQAVTRGARKEVVQIELAPSYATIEIVAARSPEEPFEWEDVKLAKLESGYSRRGGSERGTQPWEATLVAGREYVASVAAQGFVPQNVRFRVRRRLRQVVSLEPIRELQVTVRSPGGEVISDADAEVDGQPMKRVDNEGQIYLQRVVTPDTKKANLVVKAEGFQVYRQLRSLGQDDAWPQQWDVTLDSETDPTFFIASAPEGAEVTIDGKHVGTTPLEVPLTDGEYRFELERKAYKPWQQTIRVAHDRRRLTVQLAKQPDVDLYAPPPYQRSFGWSR